ncbi:ATP-grasp domain-containing protein [Altibacter sp. HG106]|uniref:ATP-grasp domain-containing protein n=1 Tax=Altibacter sp. HG106 TaxID=3023937 RepID=UPI0023504AAC|nr:RimK family alpha-L-glutamate ligase [Altibacter sp. HG106]MDC7995122.1 RimK family alpha-L-glutamate ligase [Altibacter sp. HG106]
MNIAILSRGEYLYSTQSLLRAGAVRNHVMEVLDPTKCSLTIEQGKPVLYFCNEVIDDLDAVIPRIGASNTFFGSSLVRHLEAMKVFTVVRAESILQSRNKWTSFQLLAKAGVSVPKTILGNVYDIEEALTSFQKKPVILKVLQGTHGQGVILAETYASALSTIETLQASGVRFVIQEYIAESKGCDLRAIVVGGKVVAAMKRQSKSGDFRSNLHRGGTATPLRLSEAEKNIAIQAARVLQLGVCGVDILQTHNGPVILEVNSTPGLEGIEKTTGVNISESIITYIERQTHR